MGYADRYSNSPPSAYPHSGPPEGLLGNGEPNTRSQTMRTDATRGPVFWVASAQPTGPPNPLVRGIRSASIPSESAARRRHRRRLGSRGAARRSWRVAKLGHSWKPGRRPVQILAKGRTGDLADGAMLPAGPCLQVLCEPWIDSHLNARRCPIGAKRGSPDRDLDRPVEVVAALGLVSEFLNVPL